MTMKHCLFATFLMIFAVTAAITLLGIINVVQIKEGYLDKLFYMLIAECIGSVVSLFKATDFFGDKTTQKQDTQDEVPKTHIELKAESEPEKPRVEKNEPEKPQVEKIGPASAEEYFEKLDKLSNRFAEKAEYEKKANGSMVKWEGIVKTVFPPHSNCVQISLRADKRIELPSFYLELPEPCIVRALALQPGDRISFTGKLSTLRNQVDAETFDLLNEAGNKEQNNKQEFEVVYESPCFFKVYADKKEGPFCQHCKDADEKWIRLQPMAIGEWECLRCKNVVYDSNYNSRGTPDNPRDPDENRRNGTMRRW